MSKTLDPETAERLLNEMAALLDRQRRRRQTLTYLQLADALAMPGPCRIHKTTRLLERLLKQDLAAGRPPRAALVVSRQGTGLPAEGFFHRAQRLGAFDGGDPVAFHAGVLAQLFAETPGS